MEENFIKSKVQVYTHNHVITGYIDCQINQRLLDFLNQTRDKFLNITDVNIRSTDDTEASYKSIYVNRENMFFVKEIENSRVEKVAEELKYDVYPYVHKSKVDIIFLMPSYTLCGKMHLAKGQTPDDLLNSNQVFFPLTEVLIISSKGPDERNIDFVAVNTQQILTLTEIPETH